MEKISLRELNDNYAISLQRDMQDSIKAVRFTNSMHDVRNYDICNTDVHGTNESFCLSIVPNCIEFTLLLEYLKRNHNVSEYNNKKNIFSKNYCLIDLSFKSSLVRVCFPYIIGKQLGIDVSQKAYYFQCTRDFKYDGTTYSRVKDFIQIILAEYANMYKELNKHSTAQENSTAQEANIVDGTCKEVKDVPLLETKKRTRKGKKTA